MPSSLVTAFQQIANAWRWWILVLVSLVLDQVTKIWASRALDYDRPVEFTSFFNLTLRHNHGAAFSFLHDQNGWQRWFFTVIASAVSVALMVWITRINGIKAKAIEACALALILSGALGNLFDRVAYGYVIDFLELHYKNHYWPAFNIADSAICLGAGLIILDMLVNKKEPV